MASSTRSREEWRRFYDNLTDDNLREAMAIPGMEAFLDGLLMYRVPRQKDTTHTNVQISLVEEWQIKDVFGLSIPRHATWNPLEDWKVPDISQLTPGYREMKERFLKYFAIERDPITRTLIDLTTLEALHHMPADEEGSNPEPVTFFGEVALSYTSQKKRLTFSGAGEYILGYGEAGKSKIIENLSLVGEAKAWDRKQISNQSMLQALTYMAIIHEKRKEAGKVSAQVMGFATNWNRWIFLRIDDDGKVSFSQDYQYETESGEVAVIRILSGMLLAAGQHSPTMTPSVSTTDISVQQEGVDHQATMTVHEFAPEAVREAD
ncbi:hypothetical protein DFJ77DRAFT_439792 [Powellomyces hirtus]|nr:hypothetical protein DFJ77DRAFT_439792 [Powellomyces hirtus]